MSLLRIDEIFNFEKGLLQSSKCVPGTFNFITASSEWKSHIEYTHDCEALVFAAAASGSLGRTHYVNGKFIASDLCFIVTPKNNKKLPIDLKFYHLVFNELKDEIVRNTKAGTSKEAIGLASFGKYELPYLNINAQIEIRNQFTKLEKLSSGLVAEFRNQFDLVKKLRQQLLQDAVQGKLVKQNVADEPATELLKKIKAEKALLQAQGKLKKEKELPPLKPEEIPFEIPENWVWCRLGEIANFITSGSRDWAKYYSSSGAKFVRMGNLSRESYHLRMENTQYVEPPDNREGNRTKLLAGDILISITGEVGNLGLVPHGFGDAYINQHTALVRLNSKINIAFLVNTLLTPNLKSQFALPNRGMKNSFRLSDIALLKIPLPPFEEQNRIVQKLDEIVKYCDDLEASIKQSEVGNEKLLQQVLREALRG